MEQLPGERARRSEGVPYSFHVETGCAHEPGELLRLEAVSLVIVLIVVVKTSEPTLLLRAWDVKDERAAWCEYGRELLERSCRVSEMLKDVHTPNDTTREE